MLRDPSVSRSRAPRDRDPDPVRDPVRVDLRGLLDGARGLLAAVGELCAVLQLPQSTVSRHLKTLADAGWVASRRDGTSRYYTLALDEREPATRRLWPLLREQVSLTTRRRPGCAAAEGRAGAAPDEVAGVLRVGGGAVGPAARRDCSARASYLQALPGLLDESWIVGDLGCGTGPDRPRRSRRSSRRVDRGRSHRGDMLQAARRRLRDFDERRSPARRARGAADRRRGRSTRRRCCWCCITCPIPARRCAKPRAC